MVDPTPKKWRFSLGFGPVFESYRNTNVRIRNAEEMYVRLEDVKMSPRRSMSYYKLWEAIPEKDPQRLLQWIDEPTNAFTFTFSKPNAAFGLRAFHPKVVLTDYEHDQTVHAEGVIRGEQVNGPIRMQDYWNDFRNTRRFYNWQIFGEKRFDLGHGFSAAVGGSLGLYTGYPVTEWYKADGTFVQEQLPSFLTPLGVNVSAHVEAHYDLPKTRLTLSARADIGKGHVSYAAMGGTIDYAMNPQSLSASLHYRFGKD